jgi:hypothetical protein
VVQAGRWAAPAALPMPPAAAPRPGPVLLGGLQPPAQAISTHH